MCDEFDALPMTHEEEKDKVGPHNDQTSQQKPHVSDEPKSLVVSHNHWKKQARLRMVNVKVTIYDR